MSSPRFSFLVLDDSAQMFLVLEDRVVAALENMLLGLGCCLASTS